ncbi:M16 family metallopeptidase [Negadavirga shengliensis]|uniref:M16 family metallopeptidase n=1 Tax=Negadavirga shengliensis TaxID=1389218 RepID=A0ABV9T6P2_9BACT
MINYQQFTLENGLKVLVHEDPSSEMAVFNLLYKVGSRNEVLGKTGLAHYFEHLMFGGSRHVANFDSELERVGGECNAFTNTDITNYYISLPAINIETAFWLESDRMMHLSLYEKTIEAQRSVVIEEFKQRYLNQPYGDAMHHVRNLAYQLHPYRWPTIGEKIEDIERFEKKDLEDFFSKYYSPDNAILAIAGNIKPSRAFQLAQKWFGAIPPSPVKHDAPPAEPVQRAKRTKTVFAEVPTDALYKVYHIPGRLEEDYIPCDLITDIIGFGRSSLLEQKLVKNSSLFASISAYVLGNEDPGLMVITGKMEKGVDAERAEEALDRVLDEFKSTAIDDKTLEKIKNQSEAIKTYESVKLLNRAMKLAYYSHLGSPDLYEKEFQIKLKTTSEQILRAAKKYMTEENASVVYYKREQKATLASQEV